MNKEELKKLVTHYKTQVNFSKITGINNESICRVLKGQRAVPKLWHYKIKGIIGNETYHEILTTVKE